MVTWLVGDRSWTRTSCLNTQSSAVPIAPANHTTMLGKGVRKPCKNSALQLALSIALELGAVLTAATVCIVLATSRLTNYTGLQSVEM